MAISFIRLCVTIYAYLFGFEAFVLSPIKTPNILSKYFFPKSNRRIAAILIENNRNKISNTLGHSFVRYSLATTGGLYGDSFDEDFAESISKPIPQWYKDSNGEREKILKEVEQNRERIIQEFKAKYEVTEEQKAKEREERWAKLQARSKKEKKANWLDKVKSIVSSSSSIEDRKLKEEELALQEDAITTKEKWEKFWVEEEKQTGFYLPGFFEVFPELQLKWPKWTQRKDGSAIDCKTDADCPFPQACCNHPIIPGQQFCCTGWGQRIMVPAYARQEISSSPLEDASRQNSPGTSDGKSWNGCDTSHGGSGGGSSGSSVTFVM
mmetsp:Transcript_23240/g.31834  ORF Transcript_23240/g.31834 Transcript_23240/m.31834 type:complete len:324 (+) Transcript_23240:41-1012(+)